ncbi:Sif2p [Lachancea thermotolerans CBS 6340]|uniref:KLTH0E15158p n=1 Tax=Lachancea thermotolerans (strain ATCC 56472 / CBS 6340 / NRRL Y-8284) TaxID=559295 RepID=C5DIU0_LACTC|nr:KLTH0E15158p [Lachancea thermotolerans CBS 6340]CAR23701.1 KLTH0E15158p [Lachancea thermotolerans CBS 6340]
MSLTSEELNYLIWRYLQESGKEVSALALQEESRVLEFESKFGERVPIGTLVNFVQKGILYAESELMVRYDRESMSLDPGLNARDFNLAQALEVDKERVPELKAVQRFALEDQVNAGTHSPGIDSSDKIGGEDSSKFIKTLHESLRLPQSTVCQWNPKNTSILSWGGPESTATIATFEISDGKPRVLQETKCQHPLGISASTGKLTNDITCLEWSPSGESIVTGVENGELRLWTSDGKLQNVFNFHKSGITTIKWNEDSTHFLTCDVENVAIVWNSLTGTALQHISLKESGATESLGVDASWVGPEKFVIPGLQGAIALCGIGESRPLGKLNGHTKTITALDYNYETKMLLSGSDDTTLRVWRSGALSSSNCFMGNTLGITSAFWLDQDRVISTSFDGSVRVWSQSTNALLGLSMVDGIPIFCGSLSPDKRIFAIGKMDGEVCLYHIGKLLELLNDKSINDSTHPTPIPICGDYQHNIEGSYVNGIAWNASSTHLSISYSSSDTELIFVG